MERIHQFWEPFEKLIFWRDALAGKPARSQEEASKRPGRGLCKPWLLMGFTGLTVKPYGPRKLDALRTGFLHRRSLCKLHGFLQALRTVLMAHTGVTGPYGHYGPYELCKRPARGQQRASKKRARSQQEASKRPGRSPNEGDPTKHRNH